MNWNCKQLENVSGWFSTSSPFLRFFRSREDGNWIKVHETPPINKNLNPDWEPFKIRMQKLCNGDPLRPIKIECWAFGSNSKHKSMGECQITIDDIKRNQRQWNLVKTKKGGSKKTKGTLFLKDFKSVLKYEFLDYIRGGEELNLICAIDFTGSNGIPSAPNSLHATNNYGQLN